MKYRIGIGRLCVNGSHRQEICNFIIEASEQSRSDPELSKYIEDVLHIPVAQVPTSVARNKLVKSARKNEIDILFMIDDDMGIAEGFYKAAIMHIIKSREPCVIGAPYCCGPPLEEVQVFEFASPSNCPAQRSFSLNHIGREDAARRTGIERVANIGTGCIVYDMRVFDKILEPYYDYSYNEDMTSVTETEDTYCHRRLYFAGVPIYTSWNHWAVHYKTKRVEKPYILAAADIEKTYVDQAYSLVTKKGEDKCVSP